MICWDVHFPEVARELAARGAEVIFMPMLGRETETLARARARSRTNFTWSPAATISETAIFDKTGDNDTQGNERIRACW